MRHQKGREGKERKGKERKGKGREGKGREGMNKCVSEGRTGTRRMSGRMKK